MKIKNEHIEKVINLKKKYFMQTKIPMRNNWRNLTDNDIWLRVITQILIIGSSVPADKFESDRDLKEMINYSRLQEFDSNDDKMKIIHYVLRKIGCRYVSEDMNKGWKVKSLTYNFNRLQQFNGGPTGFLVFLNNMIENNNYKLAIETLKGLKGFKDKSSRDFLMEYGMVDNCIAIDIRLYSILNKLGIEIPTLEEIQKSSKVYCEVEEDILKYICRPTNLSGIEFDRMLYQNYSYIMHSI